jgi:predicted Zn-dependent peptidase
MWDPYAEFETAVLPNGLTVHVAHWPNRPWIAAGFLVYSGARSDSVDLEGTAHFVEHLVSRNARRSYSEIKRFFEGRGGSVELGTTGYHRTYYQFFSPIADVTDSFEIFGSMLLGAKLENFIEAQRQVILGEFQRKFPLEVTVSVARRKNNSVFPGTWLERYISPMGAPDSIRRITQRNLQEFYDEHYAPANMSIVCVGGLSLSQVIGYLENSLFGTERGGIRTQPLEPLTYFTSPRENRYVFEYSKHVHTSKPRESGEYSSIAVIPGIIKGESTRVVKDMLGKILFDEVREKRGWTYSISANSYSNRAFHEFVINADAIALESLDEVETVINDLIASMVNREDLFQEKVRHILAGLRMVDMSAKKLCEMAMSDLQDYGRIVNLTEYAQLVSSVTHQDVLEVLVYLKPERRWTILTTP